MLRRIPHLHSHLLAQNRQRRLDLLRLSSVPGIHHSADHSLMHTQPPRQLRVVDSLIPHRHIERQLRRKPKGHRHQSLPAFYARRHWNLLTTRQANRKIGPKRIHGLLKRLTPILTIRRNPWKIDKLNQYPTAPANTRPGRIRKSEHSIASHKADALTFQRVRSATGLDGYRRNPLTYLTEAADDIAYVTGDIEDVLKKGFVDYATIRESLDATTNESKECVEKYLDTPYKDFKALDARERRQLAIQRFCQMAIRLMVKSAIRAFLDHFEPILKGSFPKDLTGTMSMSDLCG